MFPFDVILFDVGGVLLTNGWDTQERTLAIERFHLDPAGFEARHQAAYPAWERGTITVRDYLDATVGSSRRFPARTFTPDCAENLSTARKRWAPKSPSSIPPIMIASAPGSAICRR